MEGEEQPEKEESGYQGLGKGLGGSTGLLASPGDRSLRGTRCPSALSDMLGFKGRALERWVRGLGLSRCIKGQASWAGIYKGHKNINGIKKCNAAW